MSPFSLGISNRLEIFLRAFKVKYLIKQEISGIEKHQAPLSKTSSGGVRVEKNVYFLTFGLR